MPTYPQMAQESWYRAEVEAPAHAAFNEALRKAYGLGPAAIGSKGDNNHLYGRHRSRSWALNSRYCEDRSYGTTDPRDRAGPGDYLRATDIGINGPTHWAAVRRLDVAVRAGQLPCVAEWFGTVDGQRVIGWFEGGPSSSDTSHLWHIHVGLWTSFCDDAAQLNALANIITGRHVEGTVTMLIQVQGKAPELWITDGVRRRQVADAAGVRTKLVAAHGQPVIVANDKELGWIAGPTDVELGGSAGGGAADHTHPVTGSTGPAQPS